MSTNYRRSADAQHDRIQQRTRERAEREAHHKPCSCHWETGTWFPCERHMTPHSQHTPDDPAPGCPHCQWRT